MAPGTLAFARTFAPLTVFAGKTFERVDDRADYGEERTITVG